MRHTDEELWGLCIEGSKDAFEKIYKRFYPLLYNYGLKKIADGEIIKDCIQELFIKMIRNHQNLQPTLSVKSYLLKALRNTLIDTLEKQKGMEDISLYEDTFITDDLFNEIFAEEKTITAEQSKKLIYAFQKLSSRQKEIVYLYYINELTHEEIAEALNINYQSSKNLLFRSLSKLRRLYFDT